MVVKADTTNFQIDFEALEKAINPNTKAIIINSPNNPSGAIYDEATIRRLSSLLEEKQKEYAKEIYLISDEPYREIAYDGVEVPYVTKYYRNTIVCYSYSKSLSLPGERIGYILVRKQGCVCSSMWSWSFTGLCVCSKHASEGHCKVRWSDR